MPFTWMLLIRHGRTALNVQNVYAGWMDIGLDEVGAQQASALGRRLRSTPLAAVYSSPLPRAIQTAEAIRVASPGSVQTVDELTELRMPGWQGLGEKEIAERNPVEWQAWCRSPATLECPYIESLSSASARVRRVVSEIGNRHPREAVALVTHEAIVRLIILTSLGLDLHSYRALRVPNASLSVVGWRHRESRLWLLGDTSHYDGGELGFLAAAANPSGTAASTGATTAG